MTYMPILSLMVTFWLYTNKQMFGNSIDPLQTQDEVTLSHHSVFEISWSKLGPAHKTLLIFIPLIFVIQISEFIYQ